MPRVSTVKCALAKAGEYFRRLGKAYPQAMQRGLIKGAAVAVNILQRAVETAPPASPGGSAGAFNEGTYKRGWKAQVGPGTMRVFNTVRYALVIEYGRRPGARMPPVDAIARWVLRKGLAGKGRGRVQRARGIAFAIAKKIAERGLQGRYVLRRSLGPIREAINEQCRMEMRAAAARLTA